MCASRVGIASATPMASRRVARSLGLAPGLGLRFVQWFARALHLGCCFLPLSLSPGTTAGSKSLLTPWLQAALASNSLMRPRSRSSTARADAPRACSGNEHFPEVHSGQSRLKLPTLFSGGRQCAYGDSVIIEKKRGLPRPPTLLYRSRAAS